MKETDIIKGRRSIRAYTPKSISNDIIDDVLECARLAPTARNREPWLFGAVTERKLLEELGSMCDTGSFIADAGVCFVVFTLRGEKYFLEDGCAATMNIIHACLAHGLGSCWVAGDKKPYAEDVRKLLNVPEEYRLIALVPAGYPAEQPREKSKKPKEDACFTNTRN